MAFPKDIQELTSLRFFAALFVFIFHLPHFVDYHISLSSGFMGKGRLAVDFFFILSGFILTHVYADQFKNKTISWRHFYTKRLARIYPLHVLTLLGALVISLSGLTAVPAFDNTPGNFFSTLFLIHSWGVVDTIGYNVPSWSLSAEWLAYLLFPALLLFVRNKYNKATLAFFLLVLTTIWAAYQYADPRHPLTTVSSDFSMLRVLPEFLCGMALYVCRKDAMPDPQSKWVVLIISLVILFSMQGSTYDILIIYLFLILIARTADLSYHAKTILRHPVLVYLGKVSFAFFMLHYLIMLILYNAFLPETQETGAYVESNKGVFVFAAFFLTLGASIVAHHFFEKPWRNWIVMYYNKVFDHEQRAGNICSE